MSNKTSNYGLTKPLPEEFYDVKVQNDNMDKIDTTLKALSDHTVNRKNPHNVTAEQIGAASKEDLNKLNATEISVILPANAWEDNAQEVFNENFTNDAHSYLVAPSIQHMKEYAGSQVYADDVTTMGKMMFHCVKTPGSDITVQVLKVVMQ